MVTIRYGNDVDMETHVHGNALVNCLYHAAMRAMIRKSHLRTSKHELDQ